MSEYFKNLKVGEYAVVDHLEYNSYDKTTRHSWYELYKVIDTDDDKITVTSWAGDIVFNMNGDSAYNIDGHTTFITKLIDSPSRDMLFKSAKHGISNGISLDHLYDLFKIIEDNIEFQEES